jgi:hypothetical protein
MRLAISGMGLDITEMDVYRPEMAIVSLQTSEMRLTICEMGLNIPEINV